MCIVVCFCIFFICSRALCYKTCMQYISFLPTINTQLYMFVTLYISLYIYRHPEQRLLLHPGRKDPAPRYGYIYLIYIRIWHIHLYGVYMYTACILTYTLHIYTLHIHHMRCIRIEGIYTASILTYMLALYTLYINIHT